jgi:hypothetical protein
MTDVVHLFYSLKAVVGELFLKSHVVDGNAVAATNNIMSHCTTNLSAIASRKGAWSFRVRCKHNSV